MVSFLRHTRFSNTVMGNLTILIDGSNPSRPNLKKTIVEIKHKVGVKHYDAFLKMEYFPQNIILANIDKIQYFNRYVALFDNEKNIMYDYYLNDLTVMCRIKLFIKWMVLLWANGKIW